jgi:hypothetical protein
MASTSESIPAARLETAASARLRGPPAHPRAEPVLLRWQPFDVIAEGPFSPRDKSTAATANRGLGVTFRP